MTVIANNEPAAAETPVAKPETGKNPALAELNSATESHFDGVHFAPLAMEAEPASIPADTLTVPAAPVAEPTPAPDAPYQPSPVEVVLANEVAQLKGVLGQVVQGMTKVAQETNQQKQRQFVEAERRVDAELAALSQKRMAAFQSGDAAEFNKYDEEMHGWRDAKRQLTTLKAGRTQPQGQAPQAQQQAPQQQPVTTAPTNDLASQWLARNPQIAGNASAMAMVSDISQRIEASGTPINDARHYQAIDAEIQKLTGRAPQSRASQGGPAGSTRSAPTPHEGLAGPVRHTAQSDAIFREAGINMDDPKVRERMGKRMQQARTHTSPLVYQMNMGR